MNPEDDSPVRFGGSVHALSAAALLLYAAQAGGPPDAADLVARSMQANEADWAAAPRFDYCERTSDDDGVKTYDVTMLYGTPYKRLVMVDGKPLSPSDQRAQQQKLDAERGKRERESPQDRAHRIGDYRKDWDKAHRILEEMPRAFSYRVVGTRRAGARTAYVIDATPRPGYDPPDAEGRVLTAMHGEFWIDARTYQWVRASARVLHPVSIAGFLARVQPGTRFELEQRPVGPGVWLPSHFSIRSHSSILLLFHHHVYEDHTYFSYRPTADPGRLEPDAGSRGAAPSARPRASTLAVLLPPYWS